MCTTSYNNKQGCPGLHMDMEILGGEDNGAEVITWDNPGNFYYLLFVHDFSNDPIHYLNSSGVRVSLYSITGQVTRFTVPTVDPHEHTRWMTFIYPP